MSFRRFKKHDDTETAILNFALTFAKALLVFCVVMFIMISPDQKKNDGIKPKMEYMLTISWPGTLDYDVDTWIRDPDGKVVWYGNKQADFLNLERDDMGKSRNTVVIDGKPVVAENNEELVAIRGFKPGEYIVNVHLYSAERKYNEGLPVPAFPVTLTITKMNPTVKEVYKMKVQVEYVRQEVHIVRFTLTSEGEMQNFTSDLPVMLREKIENSTSNSQSMTPTIPPTFGGGGGFGINGIVGPGGGGGNLNGH